MTFPKSAPSANPVFFRTYSRQTEQGRETWNEAVDRVQQGPNGIIDIGKLDPTDAELAITYHRNLKALPSGRALWVSGTPWLDNPANNPGLMNCNNTTIECWEDFRVIAELLMMGTGVGFYVGSNIDALPPILRGFDVTIKGEFGDDPNPSDHTEVTIHDRETATIRVGDSRQGWAVAVQRILELISDPLVDLVEGFELILDISQIRKQGQPLKGFGGTANPVDFPSFFIDLAKYIRPIVGLKLNSENVSWIVCRIALFVVAGSIRRSALIGQFDSDDPNAFVKSGLWSCDENGVWKIDPMKAPFTMANLTRVFMENPTEAECLEAAKSQFYSGEGAIQSGINSIARVLGIPMPYRAQFNKVFHEKGIEAAKDMARCFFDHEPGYSEEWLDHCFKGFKLNPCFAAGTMVLTRKGHFPIESLVGKTVEVWDGDQWVEIDNFRVTGHNQPVYDVTLADGTVITATEYHKFILEDGTRIELCDLKPGYRLKTHDKGIEQKSSDWNVVTSVEFSHIADKVYCCTVPTNNSFALSVSIVTGQCAEILGHNMFCSLAEVNLNMIDPYDIEDQIKAFQAAALYAAAPVGLSFDYPKFQRSRELDPIVAVCPTGIFDFFVHLFGADWLQFWAADRRRDYGLEVPVVKIIEQHQDLFQMYGNVLDNDPSVDFFTEGQSTIPQGEYFARIERLYFEMWKAVADAKVAEFCLTRGLKVPNRCTAVQPSGTKALLTGASSGWHPPKSQRFIRRITFRRDHPVALACRDYGYSIIPAVSSKDENGGLLDDINDPRVTEWLVEIPTEVSWANQPGCDSVDINSFSFKAQADFLMQVQRYYTAHNSSSTLEYRESEIEDVANWLYEECREGEFVSAAMMPRFDGTGNFPRLPFEPISKEKYNELMAGVQASQISSDFNLLMSVHDRPYSDDNADKVGCEGVKCEIDLSKR